MLSSLEVCKSFRKVGSANSSLNNFKILVLLLGKNPFKIDLLRWFINPSYIGGTISSATLIKSISERASGSNISINCSSSKNSLIFSELLNTSETSLITSCIDLPCLISDNMESIIIFANFSSFSNFTVNISATLSVAESISFRTLNQLIVLTPLISFFPKTLMYGVVF